MKPSDICHSILNLLKTAHRIYRKRVLRKVPARTPELYDEERASALIYGVLSSEKPCMVARLGAVETQAVVNYLSHIQPRHSAWKYIRGEEPQWWWDRDLMAKMENNAGFFPATEENIRRFAEMMLTDMETVDVLGSWNPNERYVAARLHQASKVRLLLLEPYWTRNPWSRVLEGKRVLVVHPFAEDIISQYTRHREHLFRDKRVLPQFASLRVVKAVQSIGGQSAEFADWFEALDRMKQQMDSEPYDIALIGCGAYGFPLAAYAKRTGHKAVHLGGALQLLFGIRGKRWDKSYTADYDYSTLPNEYWIRPNPSTRNEFTLKVEGGCYW